MSPTGIAVGIAVVAFGLLLLAIAVIATVSDRRKERQAQVALDPAEVDDGAPIRIEVKAASRCVDCGRARRVKR